MLEMYEPMKMLLSEYAKATKADQAGSEVKNAVNDDGNGEHKPSKMDLADEFRNLVEDSTSGIADKDHLKTTMKQFLDVRKEQKKKKLKRVGWRAKKF